MKEKKEGAKRIWGSIPLATRMDVRKAAGMILYFRERGRAFRISGMISELLEWNVDNMVESGRIELPESVEEAIAIIESAGLVRGTKRVLLEEETGKIPPICSKQKLTREEIEKAARLQLENMGRGEATFVTAEVKTDSEEMNPEKFATAMLSAEEVRKLTPEQYKEYLTGKRKETV
jgi:hypothetical protein